MKTGPTVTFRNMSRTQWIEEDVARRAERLAGLSREVMSCRVLIDRPHRHHEQGNRFRVRLDVGVRGGGIVVSHEPSLRSLPQGEGTQEWAKALEIEAVRKDCRLVIKETFDIARRQLQEYAQRRRREVKAHLRQPRLRAVV